MKEKLQLLKRRYKRGKKIWGTGKSLFKNRKKVKRDLDLIIQALKK